MSGKEEKEVNTTSPPQEEVEKEKKMEEKGEDNEGGDGDEEVLKEELLERVQQRMEELETGDKKSESAPKSVPLGKEAMNAKTTEDVRKAKPIKVATSSASTDMEGEMGKEEYTKMQAMLGTAKSKDSKVYANVTGKVEVLAPGSFDPRSTLIFANCKDCDFTVNNLCTKVFVQGCENIKLEFKSKIVTHTVEVYKTTNLDAKFHCKVGTMQLDMSKDLKFAFAKTSHFGNAIWAGCYAIEMKFDDSDHSITTGYDMMTKEYADLNEERSQFKLHVHDDKLINEKVIRLPNGFPTTKREKDAFDARQERNMQILAQKMGIVVPHKKRDEKKVGRNDPCPCGSTRKYKKCCGADLHKN
eukprot:m.92994 g.92994  ORF g.92994 m.92994 type:complete len:357 (+) comp12378_c0_seq2:306-1376(+)